MFLLILRHIQPYEALHIVVRYTVNYGVTDDHAARHGNYGVTDDHAARHEVADLLVVLVDVVCYLLCKFSLS